MKDITTYILESGKGKTYKPIKNLGFGEISEIDVACDSDKEELEFILEFASKGILCNRLEDYGPGGGNPVYQFVPLDEKAKNYLQKWLITEYCDNDEEYAKDTYEELF